MPSLGPKRYDVFLSFNSQDRPAVRELAERLKGADLVPYLEEWELAPGREFQLALAEALRDSKTCVVFLGPSGLGPWQKQEVQVAIDRRARDESFPVIPVLLPGTERPRRGDVAHLEFLINASWVEFLTTLDDERAFQSLVWGIKGTKPLPPDGSQYEGVCPYRGLEAFRPEDAEFFFGRASLTGWLVSALRREVRAAPGVRFLGVLGPSGSGKSSVVLAGLVPALRAGAIEGSERWLIAILRPGDDPLKNLTAGVVPQFLPPGTLPDINEARKLIDNLRTDAQALDLFAQMALHDRPEDVRLAIVVDQFEEVFTYRPQEGPARARFEQDRSQFFANLLNAVATPGGRVAVVLTMRSDFLGACAAFPQLSAVLSAHQEQVGPMTVAELREAIERPAYLVGCEVEPGLTERLLADVEGQSGALPLLQFALTEAWKKCEARRLTLRAYTELGKDDKGEPRGIEGVLNKRANEIYRALTPESQKLCRRIFLRLTQPGEGTEDTKRRAAFDELIASEDERPAVEEVVRKLADARLITTVGREGAARTGEQPGETEGRQRPTQQTGDGHPSRYVEVAHEVLIRGWKQLRQWIDADRAGLRIHLQLTEAAREWQNHNRDESWLYTGGRLAVAREWSEAPPSDLNPLEREFLNASLALHRRREDEKLEAARAREEAERERAGVERKRAEEAEAAARQQRRLSRWIMLAAVLAGVLAIAAGIQTRRESKARDDATAAARKEAEARKQAEQNEKLAKNNETLAKANEQVALFRQAGLYADAAQLASRRGDWRKALENFDKAIESHHRDPIGLRLGKVRAWVALDEDRNAFDELEDLASQPDLGEHEGEVRLWQADLGHSRDINVEAKERLLKDALAKLAKKLGEADKAYAWVYNPALKAGFDLRLMSSLNDVSAIPTEGKSLIIVAKVNNVLHFLIFDGNGETIVDTDERWLTEKARQIKDLREQLESLWPPHELTWSDKDRVTTAVTSIVGHILKAEIENMKKLVEADKAYASGLLATTSVDAIGQFRRAQELDPFRPEATIRLAWMLSLLGRRPEAHDVLAKDELIFPEDPSPRIIHALMLASEGKLAKAEALLDYVRDNAHVSEETLTSWRSGVRFIARWHDLDTLLLDQQPGLVSNDFRTYAPFLLEFSQTLSSFRNRSTKQSDRMIFIDFPPLLAHWFHRFGSTLLRMLIFNRGALRGEIDEAQRIFPTGIFAFFRGVLLFEEGKYEDAEKAFIQSAEMPSVVKFRRMARFGAFGAQSMLLGQKIPPAALRDRVRQNIQAIIDLGDADPERAQYMAGLAVLIDEVDLARSILAKWERRSPRDPEAWAWRAFIERIGGSYDRSMTAAQEALRLKPGHWPARASLGLKSGHWLARVSLNRSMEQLREQARALAPPEADTPSPQAGDFFNLARTHALCASRPVDEKVPPTSDERADQEAHANRAMAALRRAVDAGWRDAARMAKEPDLDPLRSRDDFRELLLSLLDLAFPSDPFGHSQ
jgi:tetratricopeptide (TPR) repeat protein